METVYPKTSARHGKDQTMEWMQWIKRTVKCKKLQVKKGKKRKSWSSNNSDSETDRLTACKWKTVVTVVTVSIPLCYRIHLTLFLAVANTGRSPINDYGYQYGNDGEQAWEVGWHGNKELNLWQHSWILQTLLKAGLAGSHSSEN